MSKYLFICLSLFYFTARGQESVKLPELQKLINDGSRVNVVNFWATWCGPCVKELPFFEKVNAQNKNVNVLLVSMDYDLDPNPDKVKKFIERKKLQSKVVILTEENPSSWIEKLDKNWSGALPATLVVNPTTKKRKLIEGELKEGDLEKIIESISQ
ncbi:MAG: TlpA family protein disulfide reductase [Bacteroidetes bacterium]|nr:TlpA family protein disulfide reductase [Bacteroidota bacterium]